MKQLLTILCLVVICCIHNVIAQRDKTTSTSPSISYDESLYNSLQWRCIGPFRGGRSAAVTGVQGKPNLYYMGATGGGVWRTKDGGQTWENISDGFFGGSIGAVEVAHSDNNVIYVGGGEVTVRGNTSYGYGMWKSVDAGNTWKQIGLKNARHIPRIRVHPRNHDIVYAAVLGDLFRSSDERGVYRSKDGGMTWEKILFANKDAGAVDLILDPNNPRILYASTWRIRRTPYSLESGGEGSALWKSTDSGDTWTNISGYDGLPKGLWGISGVSVSPVNSDRVYAMIENENGGVYRSDNAGKTWVLMNSDRSLRQRAWYYTRIYADTQEEDGVYVMNVNYHHSKDGGKTFTSHDTQHGDMHDLWIAPEDNQRMIIGDDGGGQVSFDGGSNWSTYHNQPTAQFYRVTTDNHFPYRIYGAQQDNSTVRILHRTDGGSIGERDWEETAGGESAHIAVDPLDNDIVYGGSYGGFLTRVNHKTRQIQAINVWPDNPMGHGAEGMRYRFQWNFPIFFSPHDPKKLYTTSNRVHVSYDEGKSWEIISPDLTRNDTTKLKASGGPITKDNTSVEYYCTIFAGCESTYEKDLLWIGSDDGLIHLSRDGGKNWSDVTPPQMPEWMMINSIHPDPFTKGGAYVAGTRYKSGDYRPFLYKTEDYGKSWKLIVNGIASDHFTRVLRADPKRKGLLYAGTESGMYISFDDGANWKAFQLNLPIVPITDLTIKNENLIVATQGRSFWIIDDLTVLHQLSDAIAKADQTLYHPMDSYRIDGSGTTGSRTQGQNHAGGVQVHYSLKDTTAKDISIGFYEADGDSIITFSETSATAALKLSVLKPGGNVFRWDMRYPPAKDFEGRIFWAGGLNGPRALPGKYTVRLTVDSISLEQEFEILPDPRSGATHEDLVAQFNFVDEINDKITQAHDVILEIRDIRQQMKTLKERLKDDPPGKPIVQKATALDSAMTVIENELYQTKNRSGQDPLNFPIKLTNKLAHVSALSGYGNARPTTQAYAVKGELTALVDAQLIAYAKLRDEGVADLNRMVRENAVDAIVVKKKP
ncbi:MAG TPA: hypothetical protein VI603_11065 [Saprospiraceae bacterium]|nr:hypothetical protein [Saprospiraceae bacterium]